MIDQLRHRVEEMLGRSLNTSGDYHALSQSIHQRVHVLVSPTTLKRVFGYLHETVTPRRSTLDVLAQYVGYRDYEALTQSTDLDESNPILSERLNCATLSVGKCVRLTWPPDRDCTVRHMGDGAFVVTHARNTKLCVGDTFRCHLMIQHEPLYLDDYVREGQAPCAYVAGRVNGVTYELL